MILIISPKSAYITKRIFDEAELAGIKLEIFSLQELADRHFEVDVEKYNCLYVRFCYPYFEQTIELAKKFIAAGKKVVDAAIAEGDVGQGKMQDYDRLAKANIPIPKTDRFLQVKQSQYPYIVKWDYGFGGKEVFLVNNPKELKKAEELIPAEELLLQEFIPAEYEYKVITVGYKALPVILRFATGQNNWRPDFGKAEVIRWPITEDKIIRLINLAEQSSRLLKRELAKVDILEAKGKFYVLEVNRWPGLKSFEELTKYNASKMFLDYLIK